MSHISPKELNIILLGQSGIGKSTFINSWANHLKYEHLGDALENELQVYIPALLQVCNREELHEFQVGTEDHNEVLEIGRAATQDVKAYIFELELDKIKYKVRLMDTPGMGDERGTERDQLNCERILSYLSQLNVIHGICIFLKPDNSRLDSFFKYCIIKVLSQLERSAAKNVFFVFTNTRGHNYSAGQTYSVLAGLLNDIKIQNNIEIPLSRENVFCFDNEAFKYIAAVKHGINFDQLVRKNTETSWNISAIEYCRLIHYVYKLKPHNLKKTLSINDARMMASNLTRPAVDIIHLIGENINKMENLLKDLKETKFTKEQMRVLLNSAYLDIRIIQLDYPLTVCAHLDCIEVHYVDGIQKNHYKKECCHGCAFPLVTPEVTGSISLYGCTAFGWLANCRICKHGLNLHKHITYMTEVYKKPYSHSEELMLKLAKEEDEEKLKTALLKATKQNLNELQTEQSSIVGCSALMDKYLKDKSIISAGFPVKNYLQSELERTKQRKNPNDQFIINQLQILLDKYEKAASEIKESTTEQVQNGLEELMKMKHFGPRINEMYNVQKQFYNKMAKNGETQLPNVQCNNWFYQIIDLVKTGMSVYQILPKFGNIL